MATDGDEQECTSKARAYKLLAAYYADLMACDDLLPGVHPDQDPDRWLEYCSPLNEFGWPKEEFQNFDEWIDKSRQNETTSSVQDKPWLIENPNDPKRVQDWYTPARYFARKLVTDDSTLLTKRDRLVEKVVQSLTSVGIKKRGGKKPLNPNTVKKALSNVSLG